MAARDLELYKTLRDALRQKVRTPQIPAYYITYQGSRTRLIYKKIFDLARRLFPTEYSRAYKDDLEYAKALVNQADAQRDPILNTYFEAEKAPQESDKFHEQLQQEVDLLNKTERRETGKKEGGVTSGQAPPLQPAAQPASQAPTLASTKAEGVKEPTEKLAESLEKEEMVNDPDYQKMQRDAQSQAGTRIHGTAQAPNLQTLSPEATRQIISEEQLRVAQEFVAKYPEKAKLFQKYNPAIKKALELQARRAAIKILHPAERLPPPTAPISFRPPPTAAPETVTAGITGPGGVTFGGKPIKGMPARGVLIAYPKIPKLAQKIVGAQAKAAPKPVSPTRRGVLTELPREKVGTSPGVLRGEISFRQPVRQIPGQGARQPETSGNLALKRPSSLEMLKKPKALVEERPRLRNLRVLPPQPSRAKRAAIAVEAVPTEEGLFVPTPQAPTPEAISRASEPGFESHRPSLPQQPPSFVRDAGSWAQRQASRGISRGAGAAKNIAGSTIRQGGQLGARVGMAAAQTLLRGIGAFAVSNPVSQVIIIAVLIIILLLFLVPVFEKILKETAILPIKKEQLAGGSGQNSKLKIVKSGPDAVADNTVPIQYQISITYTGSGKANIEVTDKVPEKTTFQNASDGGIENSGTVKWELTDVAGNDTKKITLTVQATQNDIWVQDSAEAKITSPTGGGNGLPADCKPPVSGEANGEFEQLLRCQGRNVSIYSSEDEFASKVIENVRKSSHAVARTLLNNREQNIRRVYQVAVSKNVNPLLVLATWGTESGYSLNPSDPLLGCSPRGEGGSFPGFEAQLSCGVNTWNNWMSWFEDRKDSNGTVTLPSRLGKTCIYSDGTLMATEKYGPICTMSDSNENFRPNIVIYYKIFLGQ